MRKGCCGPEPKDKKDIIDDYGGFIILGATFIVLSIIVALVVL